jgi:hypothetical protein
LDIALNARLDIDGIERRGIAGEFEIERHRLLDRLGDPNHRRGGGT